MELELTAEQHELLAYYRERHRRDPELSSPCALRPVTRRVRGRIPSCREQQALIASRTPGRGGGKLAPVARRVGVPLRLARLVVRHHRKMIRHPGKATCWYGEEALESARRCPVCRAMSWRWIDGMCVPCWEAKP